MAILLYLLVKDDNVEEDVNFALSAFIFAVSLFFVSENCVAMTTRQRFIMKKDPTYNMLLNQRQKIYVQ